MQSIQGVLSFMWDLVFFAATILSLESFARESPLGRRIYERMETGVMSVITWRSQADNRTEVALLRQRLILGVVIATFAFAVLSQFSSSGALFFARVALYLWVAWVSLEWTFDHRAQLRELRWPALILLVIPWLGVPLMLSDPNIASLVTRWAAAIGFPTYNPVTLAVVLAILGSVAVLLILVAYYVLALVAFLGVSAVILLILYGSTWLSQVSVRWLRKDIVKAVAFVIVVVGAAEQIFFADDKEASHGQRPVVSEGLAGDGRPGIVALRR